MKNRTLFDRALLRAAIDPRLRVFPIGRLIRQPEEIALELTNICNLSCVMCFRKRMRRPKGLMSLENAKRWIDQIGEFPKSLFLPQGFGESLVHPKFLEVMRYARSAIPNRIVLITNGTLLRKEMSREIIRDRLADGIIISVETGLKDDYERIRVGGDFDQLDRNISDLLEQRVAMGVTSPSLLLRGVALGDKQLVLDLLRDRWGRMLAEGDGIGVNSAISWTGAGSAGVNARRKGEKRPLACRHLWRSLTINVDGEVTPCCLDFDFHLSLGNINSERLIEMWRGRKLSEYRNAYLSGDLDRIPLCKSCNDWE
ncbi:MAG: SPASM domain-containing protein [Candidatus Coatesbacteria bacterium]|nr:SPASM domain-containing protein [Candidatus Coatesbacteria bacterium]